MHLLDFIPDTALIREARYLADKVFSEDPLLDGIHGDLRPHIKVGGDMQHARRRFLKNPRIDPPM